MKILWVSSIAWLENDKYKFPVNGPGAVSGSLFQQSIIEGLESEGGSVDILCDYPIKNRYTKGFKWSHNGRSDDKVVSTINIPVVSLFLKTLLMFFNSFTRNQRNTEYNIAVAYLIHSPYLVALWIAKKMNKSLKTVLICPDLPQYMDMSLNEKPLKSLLKKIDYWLINKLIKNIDAYVLFSESMQEKLQINEKKKVVIEGVYSPNGLNLSKRSKMHAIMHAGTLHKNIGIENIIEAFKFIEDEELEFWIFGDGELRNYIQNATKIDNRIKYYGFVSREELFEYQKQAKLLINARNPLDEYTKYSFPSKTFEYMVSGTPFLTTKLQGIPSEYYNYLYTMDNNNPIEIADKVKKILTISNEEHEAFGEKASMYVLESKNKKSQALKMKKFFKGLLIEL